MKAKKKPKKIKRVSEYTQISDPKWLYLQYNYVDWLTSHLISVLPFFDGDLTEMLILAIIGQVHLKRYIEVQADDSEFDESKICINASQLADITGLNRETIRRKLKKLEGRGWVEKDQNAAWRLTFEQSGSKAHNDLNNINIQTAESLTNLFKILSPFLPRS